MENESTIILPDDERAARQVTVPGWVSRHGRFYGKDERLARWDGATHLPCEGCQTPVRKQGYLLCDTCHSEQAKERYAALERKSWDGETPLFATDADRYFFSVEEIEEYCQEYEIDPATLQLHICHPNYADEISSDFWEYDLPEDTDLPTEIQAALDTFNAAIRAYGKPLSWSPGRYAADLSGYEIHWQPEEEA